MAQLAHVLSVLSNSLPPTQLSPSVTTPDVTLVGTYTHTHRYNLNTPTHISAPKTATMGRYGTASAIGSEKSPFPTRQMAVLGTPPPLTTKA